MFGVALHIFALLGKFLIEVASVVPPHSSFRKHLKHRIWKFPLLRQEPKASPISVDVGPITHSLGRAGWTLLRADL